MSDSRDFSAWFQERKIRSKPMNYLRKRDLKEMIKKLKDCIVEAESHDDPANHCIAEIDKIELEQLETILSDYYQPGIWKCPKCHREIHEPPHVNEGFLSCPRCYELFNLRSEENIAFRETLEDIGFALWQS